MMEIRIFHVTVTASRKRCVNMLFSIDNKVLITKSVADWYKLLIKTLSSALKTMFTQRARDAITVTWKTRHFRHFTSELYKVSKSKVFEKVIPAADF